MFNNKNRLWLGFALVGLTIGGGLLVMTLAATNQGSANAGRQSTASAIETSNSRVAAYLTATGVARPAETRPPETRAPRDQLTSAEITPQPRPLVIKNAALGLVANDVRAKASSITAMAEKMNGWVVSSEVRSVGIGDLVQASIAIRVPAERFEDAVQQIKADGVRVTIESITGQDVSSQYADLASQVKNLEATETQLQKIMDSTTKTEDTLAVYKELTRVRGEIEKLKGQMQYFEQASAMSLITIDIAPNYPTATPSPTATVTPTATPSVFSLEPTANQAINSLSSTLQFLAAALIWIVLYILPLLLLFGIPGFLLYRLVQRINPESKEKE